MTLTTGTVVGTWPTAGGAIAAGTVSFTPNAELQAPDSDVLIPTVPVVATLDVHGAISVSLVGNDNAEIVPTGWSYTVTERIIGADVETYSILVPSGVTLDLADVSRLNPVPTPTAYVPINGGAMTGLLELLDGLKIPAGAASGDVLTSDSAGNATWQPASGGGGSGTPSSTVTDGTAFGASRAAGSSSTYSRGDHSHGTPATPTAASVGADVAGAAATAQTAAEAYADTNKLAKSANLSDLANAATARTNLSLGTGATANLDATAGDIQPLGITAAGATGKIADAGHVHAMPTATQVGADASGAAASALTSAKAYTDTETTRAEAAESTLTTAVSGKPALASTAAGNSAVADVAGVGVGTTAARADHQHGREAFAAPGASAIGDSIAAGTSTSVAHADHVHGRETAGTPGSSAVTDTAAAGSASTVARSDHTHAREGFGAVAAQTAYGAGSTNGTAGTVAHSDHAHGTVALSSTAPTTSAVGDSAAVGTGTTPARTDHTHGREAFGSVTAQTSYGASSANGSAATPSRSDHVHGTVALASSAASVSAVGDTATVGTGTTPARVDHVHGREAFGNVTALAAFNTASSNGTAATPSHSDHVHGAPVLPGWTSTDQGLAGWTIPVEAATVGLQCVSGTLYLTAIKFTAASISTVMWDNNSAGSALTGGANWLTLMLASTGALVAQVGIDSNGAIGVQSASFGATTVTPGAIYWLGTVWNGTPPKMQGCTNTGLTFLNGGLTAATARFAINGTSVTTAVSVTPASNVFAGALPIYFGVK